MTLENEPLFLRSLHPPSPSTLPLPTATCPSPPALYPPRQDEHGELRVNWAGGEGNTRGGNRAGQAALAENGAECRRRQRKGQKGRMIVVVGSPCQEKDPADAHTGTHKSVLELANRAWSRSVHLDAPGQWHGQHPVSGTADPGVVIKE